MGIYGDPALAYAAQIGCIYCGDPIFFKAGIDIEILSKQYYTFSDPCLSKTARDVRFHRTILKLKNNHVKETNQATVFGKGLFQIEKSRNAV